MTVNFTQHLTGGRFVRIAASLALLATVVASPAWGASYPDRPIRLVVPFNAGSNIDGTARQVAPRVSDQLGQPIVIDNRGGASGTIGAMLVANAAADGYTILMGNAPTHGLAPNVIKKLGYDPVKDFSPICRIASSAYVLAVSATIPVNSVKELIAYAKSKPGQLNYASTGNGTGVHLAGAFFNNKAGVDVKHIPYNNIAQLLGDISTGTVAMIFYPYQPLTPVVQSGKVRLLATTGAKRPSYLPQLPTMIESGMPGFAISAWHGFYAPAGTPASHVQVLYEAIRTAMMDPRLAASLAASGTEVDLASPAEFAAFTKGEVERYRQLIMLSGVKPE
jgi:tripartite-type tricarboxylate transporter receptor subunit TctC